MTPLDGALGRFREVLGPEHVLTDSDMIAGYVRDWTGRWTGHTRAVVRPGSVEEVQEVVRICHEHSLPLVPQGGNTGLVGGSIPHQGEVVFSLLRLDRLGPVDEQRHEVTVGAGVTVAALHAHARRAGLEYGVDLASRDSATIGGTIATNAGGMNVVANGDTRRQVLGLEVVFADGTVASRLGGVAKESTGPDPFQLMVGSEGTLGIITAARLRLLPRLEVEPMVILIGVEHLSEGLDFLGPGSNALEFFDRFSLEAVIGHRRLPRPLSGDHPFYILVETRATPEVPDSVEAVVDRRLWAYREQITETVNQIGVPVKLDVAVPLGRLDEFAAAVESLGLEGQVFLYGHLAEGNFHVNVVGNPDPETVVDRVLRVVVEMDGVIASEHGIGVAKSAWWRASTDPATLAVNRRIKEAFDPARILNPEVFWGS
ncbi:MAG TPA: FAD-binding oxidoreductase [Acidimicrobiia bacterium]|nr:FAD-binding oxidoreductase [Acidimicrobiia bacterium]